MESVELFSVKLKSEPSEQLKRRLARYLHMRNMAGAAQDRYQLACVGQAWIDPHTSLQMLRGPEGWRIVCRSTRPLPTQAPDKQVGQHSVKDALSRSASGSKLSPVQSIGSSQYLEARVLQVLGDDAL